MRLSISKIGKLAFLAFAFSLFLASCGKDNIDVIEEEVVEPIETIMALTMNGVTTEYDAYATYCTGSDGIFFNVSNNQLLLDTAILLENFMVNDFLIYYLNDGTEAFTIAGATFTENIGGFEFTSAVLDEAAVVTIVEANAQYVRGSMAGVFQLFSGAEVEYSVEFVAEVVAVSPQCE